MENTFWTALGASSLAAIVTTIGMFRWFITSLWMILVSTIGGYCSVMANNTAIIHYLDKNLVSTTHLNKAIFVKKVIHKKYRVYDFVTKEVFWLKKLESFNRIPTVLSFDNDSITMNYMGSIITKSTVPFDWEEQIRYIISNLELLKVSHNDIQIGEILVKDKKINLIDFQHATSTREEFRKLRKQGKVTVQPYVKDDYTSLYTEITKILKDGCNEYK